MIINKFFSSTLTGVDVQADAVRLVRTNQSKTLRLELMAVQYFSHHNIYADGKIKNWDEVTAAVANLVEINQLKRSSVAIALPSNLVSMKKIRMPLHIPKAAIESEIYTQVKQDFPDMTDIVCIDFHEQIVKETQESEIHFAVTKQEYLAHYVNCINATGLKVKIVDVECYALKRLLEVDLAKNLSERQVVAVAQIVNHEVQLIIFTHHEVLFKQQWSVGDNTNLLAELKQQLQFFSALFPTYTIYKSLLFAKPTVFKAIAIDNSISSHNPFATITLGPSINKELLAENAAEWLIAAGLSMREVPAW